MAAARSDASRFRSRLRRASRASTTVSLGFSARTGSAGASSARARPRPAARQARAGRVREGRSYTGRNRLFGALFMVSIPPAAPVAASNRQMLRQRLLLAREQFVASPQAPAAEAALTGHLAEVLDQLAPDCLGVYWPVRGEFNAAALWAADKVGTSFQAFFPLALPFAQRDPREVHYRHWDGKTPVATDEFRIPASGGGPGGPG